MVSALVFLAASCSALAPSQSWAARTAVVRPRDRSQHLAPISSLVAKRKGKSGRGAPGMPRSGPPQQVLDQQRQYKQYMKAREESGMPTFDLFVRGPNSPMWYPAGALQGDDKSKNLVESWMGGMLAGWSKDALDKGVANSVFSEKAKFSKQIIEQYPQLKKFRAQLSFGYKVSYPGLVDKRPESSKVTMLNEDMTKSVVDNLKSAFGMG